MRPSTRAYAELVETVDQWLALCRFRLEEISAQRDAHQWLRIEGHVAQLIEDLCVLSTLSRQFYNLDPPIETEKDHTVGRST